MLDFLKNPPQDDHVVINRLLLTVDTHIDRELESSASGTNNRCSFSAEEKTQVIIDSESLSDDLHASKLMKSSSHQEPQDMSVLPKSMLPTSSQDKLKQDKKSGLFKQFLLLVVLALLLLLAWQVLFR